LDDEHLLKNQFNNHQEDEMTNKSNSKHVETIRDGAIGAGIFLKTKKDGSFGHSFTITRAYKKDGEENFSYSTEFYPRNGNAMAQIAAKAAARCKELDAALETAREKEAA